MRLQTDVQGEGAPLILVGGGLTGWLSWIPHQHRLSPTRRVVRVQPVTVQLGLEAFARQAGFCPPGTSPRQLPAWSTWVQHRRSLRTGGAVWDHKDSVTRLRAFERPVLLVKGTGSTHFLHQIVDGLAAELPRAKTLEFPGGHAPHIVSIDAFLASLDELLSATPRSR